MSFVEKKKKTFCRRNLLYDFMIALISLNVNFVPVHVPYLRFGRAGVLVIPSIH